jgi:hypothetical protein
MAQTLGRQAEGIDRRWLPPEAAGMTQMVEVQPPLRRLPDEPQ